MVSATKTQFWGIPKTAFTIPPLFCVSNRRIRSRPTEVQRGGLSILQAAALLGDRSNCAVTFAVWSQLLYTRMLGEGPRARPQAPRHVGLRRDCGQRTPPPSPPSQCCTYTEVGACGRGNVVAAQDPVGPSVGRAPQNAKEVAALMLERVCLVVWPFRGRSRLAHLVDSASFVPCFAQVWPRVHQICAVWASLGAIWPNSPFLFGQILLGLGQIWVIAADFIRPNLAPFRPNFARIRPTLGEFGRMWSDDSRTWSDYGQTWLVVDQICATSVEFGPVLAILGSRGNFGLDSAATG